MFDSTATPVKNLTDPVVLFFKVQRPSKNLVAAYWDFKANGGYLIKVTIVTCGNLMGSLWGPDGVTVVT